MATEQKTVNLDRVFSGAQPTGNMHLGNYLGAFRNWVRLQDSYECIYCVVDMHAITTFQDPKILHAQTIEAAAAFMASGVNPEKSILFNQSQVAEHAELAWIFNCVARMGWLNHMTQFKDKAGKNREKASVGLYVYPNLMAADILLYKANRVPVGADQGQHLELARDIAQKFNHDFGVDLFPEIEPVIMGEATRVMSLKDGKNKMSKSDPSDGSRINLTDDKDTIVKKIKKARTDSLPLPQNAEGLLGRPEALNLVSIYAALCDQTKDQVCAQFEGQGFAEFKLALTEQAVEKIGPVTAEMSKFMADPHQIEKVLSDGASRAKEIAAPILTEVKNAIGFVG